MGLFWIKIAQFKKINYKGLRFGYYVSAIVSFVIFCAILRWEPYVSRYMIAYLALLCPAIVVVMEWFEQKVRSRAFFCFKVIVYFVCAVEVMGLFSYHGQRCWSGNRVDFSGYFADRGGIYDSYISACDYVNKKGYRQIGVSVGRDTYEYPLSKC